MKRLVGALAFLGATALGSTAMAQEIQIRGPLAGAPSCRRCVQYRVGRFSIAPSWGIGLQEDFNRTMFLGATLQYHVHEIFGIGAYGAYGLVQFPTFLASQIQDRLSASDAMNGDMGATRGSFNIPQGNQFTQQIGQINWILSVPQVTLIPLRGKLALFQNIFIDTDFYIFLGLGIIGVSERANYDQQADPAMRAASPSDAEVVMNQRTRVGRVAFTGTFGVGLNFYITRFLSLAVEYRAYPFSWNTMGTDERSRAVTCGPNSNQSCETFPDFGVPRTADGTSGGRFVLDSHDQQFRWNQMVNFSLSVFLPFQPRVGE